jgi:anti-anti-sigma factor
MTGQELDVSWSGRHAIVTMPEEIDLGNADEVGEQLTALAGQSPELITADLTGTAFCDSAGVYVLTRAHQLVTADGGELRLALGDSPVARIFELTGLDKIMPVYRDVQQSCDTPRPGPEPVPGG